MLPNQREFGASSTQRGTLKIGFFCLRNVDAKLAVSIQRNGYALIERDLDRTATQPFLAAGAEWADSPRAMAKAADIVITCLPSSVACTALIGAGEGPISRLSKGNIWAKKSTADESEVWHIVALVRATGAEPVDCPLSSGCHQAATGNIAIFASFTRKTFERMLQC